MARTTPESEEPQYTRSFAQALGRTIKVIRTDRGIERRELAERAGISYSYLTEIENGNKPPSPTVLEPLAGALGLRMFELIEAAEGRMDLQSPAPSAAAAEERSGDMVRHDSRPPRLFSTGAYGMQPSLRGSRRDLRAAVIELERLLEVMGPEDVERLLDYARRLAR